MVLEQNSIEGVSIEVRSWKKRKEPVREKERGVIAEIWSAI